MTQTKPEMTALDYTHAAHKQLAAGNERKAAGLLWKAAEATFLDLAHKRGIECDSDGNLIELAKALEADGSRSQRLLQPQARRNVHAARACGAGCAGDVGPDGFVRRFARLHPRGE